MTEVCTLPPDIKYFLYHRLVDMRKQFVGLQGIVNDELGRYVTADEAFVFIGKSLRTMKILHREGLGMTLYVRKLDHGQFTMPTYNEETGLFELDHKAVKLLLIGLKLKKIEQKLLAELNSEKQH